MPAVGLEPTRPCGQQILSLPRLPIPTRRPEAIFILSCDGVESKQKVGGEMKWQKRPDVNKLNKNHTVRY